MKNQVRAIRLNSSLRRELISLVSEKGGTHYTDQISALIDQQCVLGDKIYNEGYLALVNKMREFRSMVEIENFRYLVESNYFQIYLKGKGNENILMTEKREVLQVQISAMGLRWGVTYPDMNSDTLQDYLDLAIKKREVGSNQQLFHTEVTNIINNCNTLRQLEEAAPEWVQYFPSYLLLNE